MASIGTEVRLGLLLEVVGQALDEVRTAEWIDAARDARLVRENLLRPERQRGSLRGRQRERLVQGVGMQRVGPAEHRRERLQRGAHDVVRGLLRRQRHAGGLRCESAA